MAAQTFQLPHRSSRIERWSRSRDRKRKRSFDYEDLATEDLDDETAPLQTGIAGIAGITSLTAAQAEQYRTAGLLPHEDAPPYPFPHAAPGRWQSRPGQKAKPDGRGGQDDGYQEDAPVQGKATTLRQEHMNVMTAVMHRCLLDGDYERAGRAWSLLLRSHAPLDVRRHDQWGIGAEILMRKITPGTPASDDGVGPADGDRGTDSDHTSSERQLMHTQQYHEEGLRAARSYYDMLIRRFPGQPTQSGARNLPTAIDFNPVMLNVWLYQVAFTRRKVLGELDDRRRGPIASEGQASGAQGTGAGQQLRGQARLEQLQADELREAELISAKLDELFRSPAYDRDKDLRRLHSMVQVWIEDLQAGEGVQPGRDVTL